MTHQETNPYKGTRDFYPRDYALLRYIFDTWERTARQFGFERYDASPLEYASLYKSKGSENEELVNEQTYTFLDRGQREVTLRPEMTPSAARMIAKKRRELSFPARWYSIPNVFRYERPQKGRLREHWQFNCDIFGSESIIADIEMIALAHAIFREFGATESMYEIRVSDRSLINEVMDTYQFSNEQKKDMLLLLDRKNKINDFDERAREIAKGEFYLPHEIAPASRLAQIFEGLHELSISNVVFDPTIVRGFNYYTGTVFEIVDTSPENKRTLLGGGRYDNLTKLFDDEEINGVGFGVGDVSMRDFLETHNLLPQLDNYSPAQLSILPMSKEVVLYAEKLAMQFRDRGIATVVDISQKKIGKKIKNAHDQNISFVIAYGENEQNSGRYSLKSLNNNDEKIGTFDELIPYLSV